MAQTKLKVCDACLSLPWAEDVPQRCICQGFNLDVGCSDHPQNGFLGCDKRQLPNVSFIVDLEVHPLPFSDDCCDQILASHILEHIKPWLTVDLMNELWRITKPGGQLFAVVPYGVNTLFIQDPTHCNAWNEATVMYFTPEHPSGLYNVYKPHPWKVLRLNFHPDHVLEFILTPMKEAPKKTLRRVK